LESFINIEQFLIHSEKRAFIMARLATHDDEVALDIVQDAMLKLVSKYSHKQSHEWPPLFYRILQSRINDWYRKQTVRNRWRSWLGKGKQQDEEIKESALENNSADSDISPDDVLSNMEFSQSLQYAISQLPLRQQQAFMLRTWEGYSTRETANIMTCSEGSVKTHYSRALASLRNSLKEFSNEESH